MYTYMYIHTCAYRYGCTGQHPLWLRVSVWNLLPIDHEPPHCKSQDRMHATGTLCWALPAPGLGFTVCGLDLTIGCMQQELANSVLGVACTCTWTKGTKGKNKKRNEFGVGRYLNLDKWGKKGKEKKRVSISTRMNRCTLHVPWIGALCVYFARLMKVHTSIAPRASSQVRGRVRACITCIAYTGTGRASHERKHLTYRAYTSQVRGQIRACLTYVAYTYTYTARASYGSTHTHWQRFPALPN